MSLLAEMCNADVCGTCRDIGVIRERINNQMRVARSVNINSYTCALDGVYEETARVAMVMWRRRLAVMANMPF
jgi:hypothetical protein